jgi:PadR family transcriptional regulator, regulatory protein PadR
MLPMELIEVRRNYDRDLISGLIRVHVLYHACKAPIFGLDIIEKLQRHEYKLSPGTLYPLLRRLKKRGYLRSKDIRSGRVARRLYRATPAGQKALARTREKVRELLGELLK